MSIQSTVTLYYQAVGALGGSDSLSASMVTPTNNNAPPPGAAQLQPGNNTLLVPTGFTCNVAAIRPPNASTNAKSVKGQNADVGLSGWTNQPIMVPVTGLTSFVVLSAGVETVEIAWS